MATNYNITAGTRAGAIEVSFPCKPSAEVRDALKSLKFRWNGSKGVWYGFASAEVVAQAIEGNTEQAAEQNAAEVLNGISYKTVNQGTIYEGWEGSKSSWRTWDELKSSLQADFKKCGIKATIRKERSGYLTSITCTVTVSASEVMTFEEWCKENERDGDPAQHYIRPYDWNYYLDAEGKSRDIFGENYYNLDPNSAEAEAIRRGAARYDYQYALNSFDYHQTKVDYMLKALKESARKRLEMVYQIVSSYNHDCSDSMTDYFDRGIYDHYCVKVA